MAQETFAPDSVAPVIWRARDVAALYGVDESTVRRWERSGRLRAARLDPGGTRYWLRHEIIADSVAESSAEPAPTRAVVVDAMVVATKRTRRSRAVAR